MFDALRPPLFDVSASVPRRSGVVLLGLLATLLFAQLLSQQSVAAEDDDLLIEARIVAQRQADGSVAVWLEVRRSDDGWDEWVSPRDRVLPADAELDLWHDTGSFTVAGVTGLLRLSLRHIAHGHVELGLQRVIEQGDDEEESWAERLLPRLRQLDSPRFGPRMFTTTSIDLVDEGPALCRPGAIVRSGERCRFRDTRGEFVVDADGSASYPVGPQPTAGGSTGATVGVPPNQFRTHFSVPLTDGVAPRSALEAVIVERLEHGAYLFIRMGFDPLQPANGADCAEALLVPFGHYCGLPTTTGGNVWFVAYPGGLAHLSVPNFDLSWVAEDELHAVTPQIEYLPHYRVDAVRESGGWRLTKLIAPQPVESASLSDELEDCAPALILQRGESCGDPTSTGVYGIAAGAAGWLTMPRRSTRPSAPQRAATQAPTDCHFIRSPAAAGWSRGLPAILRIQPTSPCARSASSSIPARSAHRPEGCGSGSSRMGSPSASTPRASSASTSLDTPSATAAVPWLSTTSPRNARATAAS